MKRAREVSSSQSFEEPTTKFIRYEQQQVSSSMVFPIDCLVSIFQFCSANELAYSLPRICSVWKNTIDEHSNALWKALCFKYWPILQTMVDEDTFHITWKELYIERGSNVEMTHGMCVW
jgi:hypothetical protein